MDETSIRKLLRWDTSFVKRQLRRDGSVSTMAMALWIEVHRRRPRQRLIAWLCRQIPTLKPVK